MIFSRIVMAGLAALGIEAFARKMQEDGDPARTVARIFGAARNLGSMAADKVVEFGTSAKKEAEQLLAAVREILRKATDKADREYVEQTLASLEEEIPQLNEEVKGLAKKISDQTARRNSLFGQDKDTTQVQEELTKLRLQHATVEARYHAAVNLRRKLRQEIDATADASTTPAE